MRAPYYRLEKGTVICDRYQVFRLIGRGKNSAVYEALDHKSQSSVALKVLDPFVAQDEVSLARFKREVKIARELSHPGVVQVFDLILRNDLKCIVMEYIHGQNGAEKIASGLLSVDAFFHFARNITEALWALHKKHVVHRDLKPQNILFSENGTFKIVDFGISRMNQMSDLTKTGAVMGTPEYMAPELFQDSHVDQRADIFSLGITFYEMLTGTLPFEGKSLQEIFAQQISGNFVPLDEIRPDLPPKLSGVIAKCLQFNPAKRYQSCQELLDDIRSGREMRLSSVLPADAGNCLLCSTELIPGLEFCHSCGTSRTASLATGSHSVVIHRVEDSGVIVEYLTRVFPELPPGRVRRHLGRIPCVLVQDVNKGTAQAVANGMYTLPLEVQVVRHLPKEVQLPAKYYLLLILGLAPIFLFGWTSLWVIFTMVCLTELLVICCFIWATSPMITPKTLHTSDSDVSQELHLMANKISRIGDERAQVILGSICVAFQRKIYSTPAAEAAMTNLLEKATKITSELTTLCKNLRSQNLNQLQREIAAIEIKLKHSEISASENLIERKSRLIAQYTACKQAQNVYADLICELLNLYESLRSGDYVATKEDAV